MNLARTTSLKALINSGSRAGSDNTPNLKRDKAGKGSYESSRSSYIYAHQKLSVVFCKLRKQNGRGHVAYKLTAKS